MAAGKWSAIKQILRYLAGQTPTRTVGKATVLWMFFTVWVPNSVSHARDARSLADSAVPSSASSSMARLAAVQGGRVVSVMPPELSASRAQPGRRTRSGVAVWSHEAWSPVREGGQAWGVATPLTCEDGAMWFPVVGDELNS